MDRQSFYGKIKEALFHGTLSQPQVNGMEALLNAAGDMDVKQLAYVLATAYHETASTMQPIEEYGKGMGKPYGQRVWYNRKPYTDIKTIFYGRGFTQNTWRDIAIAQTKAAKNAGYDWDFEAYPELYLQPGPSAWASIFSMTTGLYTGRKLSQYINSQLTDFINARRIINGSDCAGKIAGYAEMFLAALQ